MAASKDIKYQPSRPGGEEPEAIKQWVEEELGKISSAMNNVTSITFVERHVVPTKFWDGLTVFADGTNWNPGSGRGIYTYYGAVWNKLG